MRCLLLLLGLATLASGQQGVPRPRQVTFHVAQMGRFIGANPRRATDVTRRILPIIIQAFDLNRNGVIEVSDLNGLFPAVQAYQRRHAPRLPIVTSAAAFAGGDLNGNGRIEESEIIALVVRQVGRPLWNTAILHFVTTFDQRRRGFLSRRENAAFLRSVMAPLQGGFIGGGGGPIANPPQPPRQRSAAFKVAAIAGHIRRFPQRSRLVLPRILPVIIRAFDANGNGRIDVADLRRHFPAIQAYQARHAPRLPIVNSAQAFTAGDINRNGVVGGREIAALVIEGVGSRLWNTAILHFVSTFDRRRQGTLSLAENAQFQAAVMAPLEQATGLAGDETEEGVDQATEEGPNEAINPEAKEEAEAPAPFPASKPALRDRIFPVEIRRHSFILLPGVATAITSLGRSMKRRPAATAAIVRRLHPDIVKLFDADASGALEVGDMIKLYPSIAQYHKDFVAGKFVPLPIVQDAGEFAAMDRDEDGQISLEEIVNLVTKEIGSPLWNTALLHFVASFDDEASQKGYLSKAEAKRLAGKILEEMGMDMEPKETTKPDQSGTETDPTGVVDADSPFFPALSQQTESEILISVPNKMELLRRRLKDSANLAEAKAIIAANAKAIFGSADLDKDGSVSMKEVVDTWSITRAYLEGTLGRHGRMVPLEEWKAKLGVKPDGSVKLSTDDLTKVMTTGLTGKMWESFQACIFNLAIDKDQDGQLTRKELEDFRNNAFYNLFRLPSHPIHKGGAF